MDRVMITGGSGFIGTNLIEYYKHTKDVINIDINSPRNVQHMQYWTNVDINNFEEFDKITNEFRPDVIIHMAARTDLDGTDINDYKTNTQGVNNLLEISNKVKTIYKVIFTSSRLVCKIGYKPKDENDYCPTTTYGESKVIGEKLVREDKKYNKKWIILRPTSIWGPWFDIPYKNFFKTIQKKHYVHPKNRRILKNFGYVKNSVHIINKLIEDNTVDKKTLYLSDYDAIEILEWANVISNQFHHCNVKQVPLFALNIAARIGDLLIDIGYKNPPLTTFRLNNLLTEMLYDLYDVKEIAGNLPYSIEHGVRETIDWMRQHG